MLFPDFDDLHGVVVSSGRNHLADDFRTLASSENGLKLPFVALVALNLDRVLNFNLHMGSMADAKPRATSSVQFFEDFSA